MTTRGTIDAFLAQKRLAVVGVSRNAKDFTRLLFQELGQRGYDVIPVNPAVAEVDGQECYRRVQDIVPKPDAALLCTAPSITETVVKDCAEAGIGHVWMYRGGGDGAVSASAIEFCRREGISVVEGECPFMFLPNTAGIHRFHGFVKKIFGKYPK
jgi:predicted CoA-binding protein